MAPIWRVLLNGKAFNGAVADDPLRAAVERLRADGIGIGVRISWEAGDGARHVAEALADGVDTLVVAGGDGTLSEIASALARCDLDSGALPSLALVPLGTANDFASAAGIPGEPLAALQLARTQPARPVDILRIVADGRSHWCANLASGGFGTAVTVETGEGLKRMLGGLAYLLTGIARLGRIEPVRARLHGPGFEWDGEFTALGLGNGRQAGGGRVLCPDARVDDGLLDITVIPELSGELGATVAALVAEGKRAALEQLATRARLPWLRIDAPRPLTLNLDGEPVESTSFRIDCLHGHLRMHLPADCPLLREAATVAA